MDKGISIEDWDNLEKGDYIVFTNGLVAQVIDSGTYYASKKDYPNLIEINLQTVEIEKDKIGLEPILYLYEDLNEAVERIIKTTEVANKLRKYANRN